MTDEQKQTAIFLQRLDCNCNDCAFMYRDVAEWTKWMGFRKAVDEKEFDEAKAKAISDAQKVEDESTRKGMLRVAEKMRFVFDKSTLLSYGKCARFNKAVSFLPGTCQIETQKCFVHRKDINNFHEANS